MATPHTVAFHTLGCKLNYSETSSIKRSFEQKGYTAIPFEDAADIYVINTCSVTDFADKKCRAVVRKALKNSPDAKVVVVGCYAQLKPQEISEIPGVDLVLGAAEKFNVLNYIDELSSGAEKGLVKSTEIHHVNSFVDAFSYGDRTRSFLKVQDGCDYKCSFCTIPQARGLSRSDVIENVVANANKIAEEGVKEVVLTGVNIGDFSEPETGKQFIDLIQELDKITGIERFRISSIEPNLCSDSIIEFVAKSERFAPHFHMPLQSGSDRMLSLMRRRYKKGLYQERVNYIKSLMPHCCIGVDVIVGFPGETEEDFMETYQFLQELDISYLHVFTFSERNNTPAAQMENQVPMNVRRERNERLRILSEKKKRHFYQQHTNSERTALFEKSKSAGKMTGFTDNYIKISIPLQEEMINTSSLVQLGEIEDDKLTVSASVIQLTH
jgi:threonylcarbamoyladenosine tRNA methylthiotransferase MtaB